MGSLVAAVPLGEERKVLNARFDALLSDLKERGLLTEHIEAKSIPEKESPAPSIPRTSAPRSIASSGAGQGRRARYEQMTFEDLLFSAESRKQQPSYDDGPIHEPTR